MRPGLLSAIRCGLLFSLGAMAALAKDEPKPRDPQTTAELQQRIEKILRDTHTPGAGVAIVGRTGPEWIAGIGLADVAANKPVTPETLFRIGSVSKGFISLSVLKLQQEGKLNLQDTLRSRAPDLEFTNPWEATDPIRIVNLLEHTTGWDDIALREYAFNPAKEVTLREGLAYNPRSRTSRWKPGTRFSYANSGPAAAAYVVEKVTGQRFEDYVEQTWFKPLGMNTASYFDTPEVQSRLTKLYHADGKTPYPYWHIIVRPSGAINASAREMANYVQFYLNRGSFGGVRLLPPEAIDRMEEPTSTYAAREGLKTGYGLSNYTTMVNQWQFHGHNGGVEGGLTELSYLPDAGVGYVFMINAANGRAFVQIGRLIRGYITRNLTKPALPPAAAVPPQLAQDYAGWYELISPRTQRMQFLLRLTSLCKVSFTKTGLKVSPLIGCARTEVAVTNRLFRGEKEAAPTLALIEEKSEGTLMDLGMGSTFRHVPTYLPWLEISVVAAAALAMASSVLFAVVWVPRKAFGRMRAGGYLSVRALPLMATLSAVSAYALGALSSENFIERFGRVTPWSIGLLVSTIAFAGFAALGLVQALRFRHREIRRWVWWHSFMASGIITIVAVYLACWGVIGWPLWAS